MFLSISVYAQENKNFKVEQTREASYPAGESELYTYVFKNLRYSPEAIKNRIEGEVMLSFFVETDSTITNIKAIGGPDFGVRDSLKVMFSKLKYLPALENGYPVRSNVMVHIPVRAH